MLKQELISVIIPAYNAETFLSECIQSVCNQTYQNIEIIIIDDGSTDNTLSIARSSDLSTKNLHVYSINNSGAANARNYGISKANGHWIAFIDSDDTWFKTKLETQMNHCKHSIWSYSDYFYTGADYTENTLGSSLASKYDGKVFEKLLISNFIGTSDVIIRKDILLEYGCFNTSLEYLEDWDLWLRISKDHEICYCNQPLSLYRTHSDSASKSTHRTMKFHLKIIEKTFSTNGIGSKYIHLKRKALSNSYSVNSYIAETERDFHSALYFSFKAALSNPKEVQLSIHVVKAFIKLVISYLRK